MDKDFITRSEWESCLVSIKIVFIFEFKNCTLVISGIPPECQEENLQAVIENLISAELMNQSISDNGFSLKQLEQASCLKEMPFYLSMKALDVRQINRILKDCPSFQPLSEKNMRGFLTGFIDLICEHNGVFYLIDYKSNRLENYDNKALTLAMKHHNYGLQYWIYSVVLHQYLKNRIADYNYDHHFGGVMYLFVRGMNKKVANSAVYQTKPDLSQLEKLERLFI